MGEKQQKQFYIHWFRKNMGNERRQKIVRFDDFALQFCHAIHDQLVTYAHTLSSILWNTFLSCNCWELSKFSGAMSPTCYMWSSMIWLPTCSGLPIGDLRFGVRRHWISRLDLIRSCGSIIFCVASRGRVAKLRCPLTPWDMSMLAISMVLCFS